MTNQYWKTIPLIQGFSKEDFLKSLGLYWRTWPEEMPDDNEIVLMGTETYRYEDGGLALPVWGPINPELFIKRCNNGDRWIPFKVLEKFK